MDRRDLIRWLVATAGLEGLRGLAPDELLALGASVHRGPAAGQQSFRALDTHAQRTVVLAAERIIPGSDTPGATDAGVVTFVDKMLADWYADDERDRFLAGLRELDERGRVLRGRDFADCAELDQATILTALDGEVAARRVAPNQHWFAMLKYLTVFGYCTSEVGMRQTLGAWPRPTRYDGCAPVAPGRAAREG